MGNVAKLIYGFQGMTRDIEQGNYAPPDTGQSPIDDWWEWHNGGRQPQTTEPETPTTDNGTDAGNGGGTLTDAERRRKRREDSLLTGGGGLGDDEAPTKKNYLGAS